jgi:hypothetical protein
MVKGKYLLFLKLNSGALQDAKVHEQVLHHSHRPLDYT